MATWVVSANKTPAVLWRRRNASSPHVKKTFPIRIRDNSCNSCLRLLFLAKFFGKRDRRANVTRHQFHQFTLSF
jgi:hypothetical protein